MVLGVVVGGVMRVVLGVVVGGAMKMDKINNKVLFSASFQ